MEAVEDALPKYICQYNVTKSSKNAVADPT